MRSPLNFANCSPPASRKRRVFWATQPTCGVSEPCPGEHCYDSGLVLMEAHSCSLGCNSPCDRVSTGERTIANNDWVRGLILNILLTDGRREDRDCGYRPGTRGGHWSDSFRGDGLSAGSLIRFINADCSVNQAVALAEAQITADMQKLVQWGVAYAVDVTATYRGRGVVDVVIEVTGLGGEVLNVGMSAKRLSNGWVWDDPNRLS